MVKPRRKPQRSLRTILIIWFLLFALVPLAFVTGYSLLKFEKAIDNEMSRRLRGNAQEISAIFQDFEKNLIDKRNRYIKDPRLVYNMATNESSAIRAQALNWLKSEISSSLTFFNRDGRMLVSVFKDSRGEVRDFFPRAGAAIFLSDQNLQKLKPVKEYAFVEFGTNQKLSLILFTKVFGNSGRHVGYVEQLIDIDKVFLSRLKNRMKVEMMLLKPAGQVVVGSHPDFILYKKDFFEKFTKENPESFLELSIRGDPFGFIFHKLNWGQTDLFIAVGGSKVEAKAVLKTVNYTFFTVVGAVIVLLIITIFLATNTLIKPLTDLVSATEEMQLSDRPIEIPIKSDTEIGLLTESFNQMSRNVIQARSDLRKKIGEVEKAYDELQETQTKLVHSSKMVSLGQLVAGVAHELNNPIGFIYSNMAHLREYADRLIRFAKTAEQDPSSVPRLKEELDIEYVQQDLQKLISSCEDGARRTRDIVLGLRNFSRLEESKLKEIDLHESIDNTLNLLAGETKNRIQVVREYGTIPKVTCFASEINQVFMNILSNAVQAIDGNGNIWISTKNVTGAQGQAMVQVAFQDSGKGMPPEVMEKVFDPFFSTKAIGQGTGLGLSISYGIIQSHGGDIQVKSQIGIGTEFILTIPVEAQNKFVSN